MNDVEIGVIGGSGLYDMAVFTPVEEIELPTPFGDPSGKIVIGELEGTRVAFLPRHGKGHTLTPSEVPYRANIFALKKLGVRYLIAISACGSLREEFEPGHVVIPDQLVDFTKGVRQSSFFGSGLVAHAGVADPFSPELGHALMQAVIVSGGKVHQGGVYITIEGPRFSTKSESHLFRQWGMDIVGMTTSPEAFLAAEAEIAYAVMANVTDYDVWHEGEGTVSVDMVVQTLGDNTDLPQKTIANLVAGLDQWGGEFSAHGSMKEAFSLVSDWNSVSKQLISDLDPIIGKYVS